MKKNTSIAKDILLDELKEQTHPVRVEDVIFWALEYYAKSSPLPTWGRLVAHSIKERILEAEGIPPDFLSNIPKPTPAANTELGAVPYEYGAMSSKFRLYATNKLTAYATMVLHYKQSSHRVVIYVPESSKEDMWTSSTGKVYERLDEIFGGEGSFDKYLEEHISEIKECYKGIERLV